MIENLQRSTSVPGAGGKKRSASRLILYAAVAGAVVGILLTKHYSPRPPSPYVLASPMAICCWFWIALSLYWSFAARNSSAVKSSESSASRTLHLILVNAAFVLSFWPYPGWPKAEAAFFVFPLLWRPIPWLVALGVFLQTGCFLLAVWARRQLGRNWSGEVTLKQDHELVRSGPYRHIRHPIYTGAIGMYVGPALVAGRLQGALAIGLVALAYTRKIRIEERILRQEFGSAYDEYRRESWAVIPWVL